MLTSFDQKQASSNIGLNWLLDGSPNDVLPASCYLESRPRYIKRFSTQKVLLKHPQTQSAAVPLSCSYLEACNTDQKYNPKALSTFFRSSGFPFFTLHNTRSPGEQLGNLFKRPPMPITAKMYRFLGPETKEVNKKTCSWGVNLNVLSCQSFSIKIGKRFLKEQVVLGSFWDAFA